MRERPILFSAEMVRAIPRAFRDWNESRRVLLDEALVEQLFLAGSTAAEIAEAFGCSTWPVKRVLRRRGLRRPARPRAGRLAGAANPSWKGGRYVRSDGYVVVWTEHGPELEHRVVMAGVLGRPLRDDEIVHHRDENKANNDPANLEVTTQSEHAKHHAPAMHAARYGR